MKLLFTIFFTLLLSFNIHAQTTAVDFTATDCSGSVHNLYTALDSGAVVILDWVMPCFGCVAPTQTAYDIAQSYDDSYPGRVLFFMFDDYGTTSCSVLANWVNSNDLGEKIKIFSDSTVHWSDYGDYGMPKIVVVGSDHNIYFNGLGSGANDGPGIQAAINQGLGIATIKSTTIINNVKWIWDANNHSGSLHFNSAVSGNLQYSIYNLLGQPVSRVTSENISTGNQVIAVNTRQLSVGTYFLRVNFNNETYTFKISVQ